MLAFAVEIHSDAVIHFAQPNQTSAFRKEISSISFIHGFPVSTELVIGKPTPASARGPQECKIYLDIRLTKLMENYLIAGGGFHESTANFSPDGFYIYLRETEAALDRLKYCPIKNELTEQPHMELYRFKYMDPARCDICCVCHENTISETSCGHFLCLECAFKLAEKKCPYCRYKLEFYASEYGGMLDSDESEDD